MELSLPFVFNFSESGVSEHVLGEVLTVMDGVEGQCGQLLLIAATNRLEKLDPVSYPSPFNFQFFYKSRFLALKITI